MILKNWQLTENCHWSEELQSIIQGASSQR